jgi:hypothetical protein
MPADAFLSVGMKEDTPPLLLLASSRVRASSRCHAGMSRLDDFVHCLYGAKLSTGGVAVGDGEAMHGSTPELDADLNGGAP